MYSVRMPIRLQRVLNQAVSYALLGGVAACGAQALAEPDAETGAPSGTPSPSGTAEPTSTSSTTSPTGSTVPTSNPGPAPTAVPTMVPLACTPEGDSSFALMNLAARYDYIARRNGPGSPGGVGIGRTESDQAGVACSNASDPASCQRALETAWPNESSGWNKCVQLCMASGVVVTRADEVRLHDDVADIKQLLGPIDTVHEAALLAQASGFNASCAATRVAEIAGGYRLVTTEMVNSCPIEYAEVTLTVTSNGAVEEGAHVRVSRDGSGACIGRRPAGLVHPGAPADLQTLDTSAGSESVGHFFAEVAALEESAIEAFRLIVDELVTFGAPQDLERAAHRAAQDEVRHAEVTARLARRYGVEPIHPQIEEKPLRPLFEFALDNVVEGCVRETYGAACARYQARAALDSEIGASLATISEDETRHAELSWQIHEWASAQLAGGERRALHAAAVEAIAELRREVAREQPLAVRNIAGMPSAEHALAMLDCLEAQLWRGSLLAAA
jgi:hypothetical protein